MTLKGDHSKLSIELSKYIRFVFDIRRLSLSDYHDSNNGYAFFIKPSLENVLKDIKKKKVGQECIVSIENFLLYSTRGGNDCKNNDIWGT